MTADLPATGRLEPLLLALLDARPATNPADIALTVAVYRRLSAGLPVADSTVAADIGRSGATVRATLDRLPGVYRDSNDEIIGFWGLTITDMPPHRYQVGRIELSTWCAWDTLFLPPILDSTAQVESVDAHTGEPIRLTVTPAGVQTASHPGIVLSFLDPSGRFDSDVIERFCHYVHFFTAADSGQRWTAQHPGTFLLDLTDAFTLGRRYAEPLITTTA